LVLLIENGAARAQMLIDDSVEIKGESRFCDLLVSDSSRLSGCQNTISPLTLILNGEIKPLA
jgi:hypothetical protein